MITVYSIVQYSTYIVVMITWDTSDLKDEDENSNCDVSIVIYGSYLMKADKNKCQPCG